MFEYLRKNASSLFIKIILGVVALVFVFWGVGSFGRKNIKNYAAIVNDQRITMQEFYREFDNFIKNYEKQYNIKIDRKMIKQFHLKEQVLNSLINRTLLYQEAKKAGIRVSDDEVRDFVITIPAFKVNGVFSKRRYVEVLRYNRIKPAEFEDKVRFDLTMAKFQNSIADGIIVTNEEVKQMYNTFNKKVKLGFIKIPFKDFLSKVSFTDNQLKEYYNKNKEKFRIPEKRDISYIEISKNYFLENYKISDKKLKEYYENHISDFKVPDRIRARHILFRTNGNKEHDKKALEKAKEVLKKLKNGANFIEMAKKYSEGPSAKNGGDLGYFTRGEMVPAFEKAAFALKKGEISGIVKTRFGYHIIKVIDIQKAHTKTFKEAKLEIEKKLENKFVTEKMKEFFNKYKTIVQKKSLKDLAKELNLKILNKKDIVKTDKNLPFNLTEAVFKAMKDKVNIVQGNIILPIFIFKVTEIKKSYIPEFNKIKDKVVKAYKEEQAKVLAINKAKKLLKNLKNISDLKKTTYYYDETNYISYFNPVSMKLSDIDLTGITHLNKKGELLNKVLSDKNNAYIIGLVDFSKFDKEKFEQEKPKYVDAIKKQKLQFQLNKLVEKLRKESKIQINQKVLI